ncbi:hypothetical protein [Haloferula sp.]|uniref:hypothetical protein n=1 Tax=Haloferula sp. TaxID=2497595 RepID=UPI00329E5AB0
MLDRERDANRERTDLSRSDKLGILADIGRSETASSRDRIVAIKVHNDMTDDWVERKSGNTRLDEIKRRAERVKSPLSLV